MEQLPTSSPFWPPELVEEGANLSPDLQKMLDLGLINGNKLPAPLRSQKAAKAFQQAFELIGGVPRLALWADRNPDKFYPLYSKLVPQTAELEVRGEFKFDVPWLTKRNLVDYTPVEDATILPPKG
jgi:hypothetical protein